MNLYLVLDLLIAGVAALMVVEVTAAVGSRYLESTCNFNKLKERGLSGIKYVNSRHDQRGNL